MDRSKNGFKFFQADTELYDDKKFTAAQHIVDPNLKDPFIRFIVPHVAVRILAFIYSKGFFIVWDEDTVLQVSELKGIAGGVSLNQLKIIVNSLIEASFFNKDIFKKYNILTSHGIQKRWIYISRILNRKNNIIKSEYDLIPKVINITKNNKQKIHEETPKPHEETPKPHEETPKSLAIYTPLSTTTYIIDNKGTEEGNKGNILSNISIEVVEEKIHEETPKPHEETPKPHEETPKPHEETPKPHEETPKPHEELKFVNVNSNNLEYEVNEFLQVYFRTPKYSRAREQLAMKSHMDLDMLMEWAIAFNSFLLITGTGLDKQGNVVKTEQDWSKHFAFWLNKQDKNKNPRELFTEKTSNNGKSKYEKPVTGGNVDPKSAFSKIDAMYGRNGKPGTSNDG